MRVTLTPRQVQVLPPARPGMATGRLNGAGCGRWPSSSASRSAAPFQLDLVIESDEHRERGDRLLHQLLFHRLQGVPDPQEVRDVLRARLRRVQRPAGVAGQVIGLSSCLGFRYWSDIRHRPSDALRPPAAW